MDSNQIELTVSIPRDDKGAVTIRKLAEQAARYVGADANAEGFGARVEEAVRAQVNGTPGAGAIPCVVRRVQGPVEVLVGTRTIALDV